MTSHLSKLRSRGSKTVLALATAFVCALLSINAAASAEPAASLPAGFQESVSLDGLNHPSAVQFSPDGRIFVAEKSGVIKVFDDLSDSTPTIFADLRTNVYNFWDRGLLGLALDPDFPSRPYVYVLYTHDAPIGGDAPRWGSAGVDSDPCPSPPGATSDGCVVSGRLSRLRAEGDVMAGSEQVLIEDWCQQYPTHSVGDLAFGVDGKLYVSSGDGAGFDVADYGQDGDPPNPCGDPPVGVGGAQTPPNAEGGALRSQDLRTLTDPTGLDGTILRLDPDTGAALPDNPLYGNSDLNAGRIVAYGLRNPFRFAIRPGTNEVWTGDVGWGEFEEINRVADPTDATVENFGWPCYEGPGRQLGYDTMDLAMCENLYNAASRVKAPFYAYDHSKPVVAGEGCSTGGSSISGLAFNESTAYPATYDGALFFADYSRNCIWAMLEGTNGLPDPSFRVTFAAGAPNPVDLQVGPQGDLFYVNLNGGEIRRIRYSSANRPPTAVAQANPSEGAVPLAVAFDGLGSSDPDPGDMLTYAWDLDDDGAYDDAASPQTTWTYSDAGTHTARLKVTDAQGASSIDSVVVTAGNEAPTVTLDTPSAAHKWRVGEEILFSGTARDPQEGLLPPSALSWSLILHHCTTLAACHQHPVQDFLGVSNGSFDAPDHEFPSYLELRLTATDSRGLTATDSVRLDPMPVKLDFRSVPTGLSLAVGNAGARTPFDRTVIVGSKNSISAPLTQSSGGIAYEFASWSDGGARSHDIIAGAEQSTYTATYTPSGPPDTTITSGPSGAVENSSAAFSFTSSEPGSTFRCRLDGAAFSSCSSPKSYANLSDGPHTFRVRAIVAAGNSDPTPAVRTWKVDTTAPNITSPSPVPKSTTEDRTPRIAATVRDAQTDLIKKYTKLYLDGEPILQGAFSYNRDTNRLTYTSERLSRGKHTVKVEARDAAANVAARTWSFRIVR
jgi:glucose/arabinose dehydrogenase/PKD repeat protein